ncbi:MAG: hypothetical protein ABIR50_06080, partial [Ginsengibacter sp.]
KITGTQPSYLLHPLDLIGGDKIQALAFFPGMNLKSDKKVEVFKYVIKKLQRNFELLKMSEFAGSLSTPKILQPQRTLVS